MLFMCGIVLFPCFLVCKGNPPHFPMQKCLKILFKISCGVMRS